MFGAKASLLVNEISTPGLKAIIAKVYKGPSWIDGNECIVLDYSQTSSVTHWVRDEIRLIAPSLKAPTACNSCTHRITPAKMSTTARRSE
jgi:hypothetical protein